jgi:GxxExxY protein
MLIALTDRKIDCEREVPVPVRFRGHVVGESRMDLVANRNLVIECKTAERICPAHHAQLLNYLRATNYDAGLILNFGPKPSFKRLIYETARTRDNPNH